MVRRRPLEKKLVRLSDFCLSHSLRYIEGLEWQTTIRMQTVMAPQELRWVETLSPGPTNPSSRCDGKQVNEKRIFVQQLERVPFA
jgi:hypothetical protein